MKDAGNVDFLALVDAHDVDPDLADADNIETLAIVDHHRTNAPPKARFVDIRHEVGATATIFVEYLKRSRRSTRIPRRRSPHRDRAHARSLDGHGHFTLARAQDLRAAAQIADVCDRDMLQDLSRHLIAPSAMDVIARALAALVVRRNFAMAGVGFVPDGERDTIAQAADFLIRREDIDTVVVYGVVGDKFIEGSLRTHSPSVDPAAWLEAAFGFDDRGRAFGGGRRDKGGSEFRSDFGTLDRPRSALVTRRARGTHRALEATRRRDDRRHHRVRILVTVGASAADVVHEDRLFWNAARRAFARARRARSRLRRDLSQRSAGTSSRAKNVRRTHVRSPEISGPAIDRIANTKPDLIVSWFWTKRLPREVIAIVTREHAFGVHPSLLPRHRGPDPFFGAIDSGDGVRRRHRAPSRRRVRHRRGFFAAGPASNRSDMEQLDARKKLDRPSLALLREIAREYANGKPPAPQRQDESLATDAPLPSEDMLEIRWSEPAEKLRGVFAQRRRGRARSPTSAARRS